MRILVLFAAGLLMVSREMTGQSPPEQELGGFPLPFPGGDSAILIQGNNGPWGYSEGSQSAFSHSRQRHRITGGRLSSTPPQQQQLLPRSGHRFEWTGPRGHRPGLGDRLPSSPSGSLPTPVAGAVQ